MPYPLLTFKPNTASPLRERLEWLTDLQTARSGAERRLALRAAPRRVFTIEALLTAAERLLLTSSLDYTLPAYWGWPAGDYELVGEQLEAEHLSGAGTIALMSMQLMLKQNAEVVEPYTTLATGAGVAAGTYLWPTALTADGRVTFKESLAWSANTFDAGHLRSRAVRYRKRTLSAFITLMDAAEVVLFRRFLHAVKGRAMPFRFTHPVDGIARSYRLAHDAVELTYLTQSVVECELRLVEL